MQYIKPTEVAQQLDIADSTLRRYCNDFAKHLSSDAAPKKKDETDNTVAEDSDEKPRYPRRRFRPSDVAILKRAKELLDAGNTIEKVNTLLGLDDFSTVEAEEAQEPPKSATTATDATQALVSLLGGQVIATQADQAQRITRQDAELGDLAEQLADLRERLAKAEAHVETLQRDLAAQGDMLRRDLEAHSRLLEAISQRLDDHAGQIGSIGDKTHSHKQGIGRTLSGFES